MIKCRINEFAMAQGTLLSYDENHWPKQGESFLHLNVFWQGHTFTKHMISLPHLVMWNDTLVSLGHCTSPFFVSFLINYLF